MDVTINERLLKENRENSFKGYYTQSRVYIKSLPKAELNRWIKECIYR